VSMIALPDLGADDNVLPRLLQSRLEADGNFVSLRTLAQPVSIDLAVQTPGQSIRVRQQTQLTVELQLPAGPLSLCNVRWLVADQEMDEVLLSRPLLKELGLDAPSIFQRIARSVMIWIVPMFLPRPQAVSFPG
jgi:hypothetical protein